MWKVAIFGGWINSFLVVRSSCVMHRMLTEDYETNMPIVFSDIARSNGNKLGSIVHFVHMEFIRIFYFGMDPIFYSAGPAVKNAIWLVEPQVKAKILLYIYITWNEWSLGGYIYKWKYLIIMTIGSPTFPPPPTTSLSLGQDPTENMNTCYFPMPQTWLNTSCTL